MKITCFLKVDWLSKQWAQRAELPPHVVNLLNNLPSQKVHPMAQFSAAVTACNTESKFQAAYEKGIKKTEYWEVNIFFIFWSLKLSSF